VLAFLCLLSAFVSPLAGAAPKSGSWIDLGSGSEGAFLWSASATSPVGHPRLEAAGGGRQVCLLISTRWQSGALEYHRSRYRQCAPTAALRRSGPPLIATGGQPSSGARVRMSAVGMIFAPAVDRLRVTLADGRTETVRLRSVLDPVASALPRLRYAAFAIHDEWCAERLVSLDAGGRTLWDSGVDDYVCGTGGDPHFERSDTVQR
jgi:hypothetical protein